MAKPQSRANPVGRLADYCRVGVVDADELVVHFSILTCCSSFVPFVSVTSRQRPVRRGIESCRGEDRSGLLVYLAHVAPGSVSVFIVMQGLGLFIGCVFLLVLSTSGVEARGSTF